MTVYPKCRIIKASNGFIVETESQIEIIAIFQTFDGAVAYMKNYFSPLDKERNQS